VFDGADIIETFYTEQAAKDYITTAAAAGTVTAVVVMDPPHRDCKSQSLKASATSNHAR